MYILPTGYELNKRVWYPSIYGIFSNRNMNHDIGMTSSSLLTQDDAI